MTIPKGPGWPDMRGWVAIGFFLLAGAILLMIRQDPALLEQAAFMQLVGGIVGAGGLGLIATFLFGASKGASDANARADKALDAMKDQSEANK